MLGKEIAKMCLVATKINKLNQSLFALNYPSYKSFNLSDPLTKINLTCGLPSTNTSLTYLHSAN